MGKVHVNSRSFYSFLAIAAYIVQEQPQREYPFLESQIDAMKDRIKFLLRAVSVPLAVLAGVAMTEDASAQATAASAWSKTDQTEVRLVSASQTIGDEKKVQLGLQFKLKPGWKVYWRSPGDAGFPPRLIWKGSENLDNVAMAWPAPTRFSVLGFETQGYKKEVVFPLTATVNEAGKPLNLQARLDYLACDDVCIPYQANFTMNIPAGPTASSDHFQLISRYLARVPGDGTRHGLTIDKAELAGELGPVKDEIRRGLIRVVATSNGAPFKAPDVFIEGPPEAGFAKPTLSLRDGGKTAELQVAMIIDEGIPVTGKEMRFTITDGDRAAERAITLAQGSAPAATVGGRSAFSFITILGLALIGGLILNLMPCVLPVLSLKLLGVVSQGGRDRKDVRASFLASAAGIIFTFLVIATALISLKLGGAAIGWGIQFQQPWFLVALTILVSFFAFNLWGIFEVRLPGRLAEIAGTAGGDGHGVGSSFATGAFATILATPCSAPFLGTAVGFALVGSFVDTYAVFAALGVGMALPFLLVAAAPGLATKLPKPGNWMIRLKQILGVALALTALWLVSVLAVQVSVTAAVIIALLMVAIGGILVGRKYIPEPRRWASSAAMVVVALAAFAAPYQFRSDGSVAAAEGHWVQFDPAAITRLVGEGKTVFVDVTAEWCITCQVNKAAVLNRGRVQELLAGGDVIAMKADWTRPDPVITKYLAGFNKFGIPFNIIYGPGKSGGVVLPELLTAGIVLDGFESATGGSIVVRK